jgi:hypothetical protein
MTDRRRRRQQNLLEFERREHIPLDKKGTRSMKKRKKRFNPPNLVEKEKLSVHSREISNEFSESVSVSKSRRGIFNSNNVYFKIKFANEVYYNEKDIKKSGMDLLVVLDEKKAIVNLPDEGIDELAHKIKHYEELRFTTILRKLINIEPIESEEKIQPELKNEFVKNKGEKRIFVEIRLFPNLDNSECRGALNSIKDYIREKGERFVSEVVEEKNAKIRAEVHLSSIRELTQGVEPISTIDKAPSYHISFAQSRKNKRDLLAFQPQLWAKSKVKSESISFWYMIPQLTVIRSIMF